MLDADRPEASDTCATTDGGGGAKAAFLYDDCCPLCRGYTATFTALGWADRQAFSTAADETIEGLDFDQARHRIPLVDPATGEVSYGLDAILGVVGHEVPVLRPLLARPVVRRPLDATYWLITYNRRHIVAAPPPANGIDCAPDRNPRAVAAYLGLTALATTALVTASGPAAAAAVASSATAAAAMTTRRRPEWGLDRLQAAGHVASVATASALAAATATALTRSPAIGAAAGAAVGARKMWLRRWLLRSR